MGNSLKQSASGPSGSSGSSGPSGSSGSSGPSDPSGPSGPKKKFVPYETNYIFKPENVKKSTNDPNIIINQAFCHLCNTIVRNDGFCKCGNVQVYGETNELGRNVKDRLNYSDCNLLEY